MKLDVEALRRSDAKACAELLAVCRHCARIGASKVGAISFADDIAQDMVMLVLGRLLAVYDGEREVEPFLIEVARRMGLSYYRRHSREPTVGMTMLGDADPVVAVEDQSPIADARVEEGQAAARAAAAKQILIRRLHIHARARGEKDAPPPSRARRGGRRFPRVFGREHHIRQARAERGAVQELIALRQSMGLTQEQMARSMQLSPHAIRSLEYGAVTGDPNELLRRARAIQKRHGADFDARLDAALLLRRWCAQLGLPLDDVSGLSVALGVHRATLFRWRTGRTQPPPHLVRELNAVVEAMAEHE